MTNTPTGPPAFPLQPGGGPPTPPPGGKPTRNPWFIIGWIALGLLVLCGGGCAAIVGITALGAASSTTTARSANVTAKPTSSTVELAGGTQPTAPEASATSGASSAPSSTTAPPTTTEAPTTTAAPTTVTTTGVTPQTYSGSGDKVIKLTSPIAAPATVTMTNTGTGNFVVKATAADGEYVDLLANEIGSYQGTKLLNPRRTTVTTLEVGSDGAWTINIAAS